MYVYTSVDSYVRVFLYIEYGGKTNKRQNSNNKMNYDKNKVKMTV